MPDGAGPAARLDECVCLYCTTMMRGLREATVMPGLSHPQRLRMFTLNLCTSLRSPPLHRSPHQSPLDPSPPPSTPRAVALRGARARLAELVAAAAGASPPSSLYPLTAAGSGQPHPAACDGQPARRSGSPATCRRSALWKGGPPAHAYVCVARAATVVAGWPGGWVTGWLVGKGLGWAGLAVARGRGREGEPRAVCAPTCAAYHQPPCRVG